MQFVAVAPAGPSMMTRVILIRMFGLIYKENSKNGAKHSHPPTCRGCWIYLSLDLVISRNTLVAKLPDGRAKLTSRVVSSIC